MTRTTTRYRGATLAGAIAIGCLINQGIALASPDPASAPVALPESAQTPAAARASIPINGLATLTVLHVPDLSAAVASGGYAGQDLLIDISADLPDRDQTFVIQRQNGDAWEDAVSGTTSGPQDTGSVLAVPEGTYRVVVPAQHGMGEFVGESFQHTPRRLTASIELDGDEIALAVDPNAAFTWQRKTGSDWTSVDARGATLANPKPGTYRVVVPDQSDTLGTVSNTVTVAAAPVLSQVTNRSTGSAPVSSAPVSDAPGTGGSDGIVATGLAQVGDSYVHGASGPNAFDCSGLTSYAYRLNGISIPRTAAAQYAASSKVSSPRPGDLVFFLSNGAEHVGIYLGNGRMVHAANSRTGVVVSSIGSGWYAQHFTGYGRY